MTSDEEIMLDDELDPSELEDEISDDESDEETSDIDSLDDQADPGDEQDEDEEEIEQEPEPVRAREVPKDAIKARAMARADELAEEFRAEFGYEVSDDVRFGWRMQEEARLNAYYAEVNQRIEAIQRSASQLDERFQKERGAPKGTGKHFATLVAQFGEAALAPEGEEQVFLMAAGLAALEQKPKAVARKVNAEPVRSQQVTLSKAERQAVQELQRSGWKPKNGKQFSKQEIKDWING